MSGRRAGGRHARGLLAMLLAAWGIAAHAVIDDAGRRVELEQPARRIISLAPGITELLYGLGAGERLVAVSEFSDYPPAARLLPRVARAQGIDLERIAALRPDLIVAWGSGYSPALLQAVQGLGVATYVYEPRSLEAIATSIERLGALTGAEGAPAMSAQFRARLAALRERYARRAPVRIFYQVWADPLMTLSGRHLVSEVMRACGAHNIFEGLGPLVASVDIESVIAARPEVIIAAEPGAIDRGALDAWRRYPQVPAVAQHHLVTLDADTLDRASVRILDAADTLCAQVDQARR